MAERKKVGRTPRGPRINITVRSPEDHHSVYQDSADELGIPLGSWVELQLSQLKGLPVPDYIQDELRKAAALREARQGQEELPMARTA